MALRERLEQIERWIVRIDLVWRLILVIPPFVLAIASVVLGFIQAVPFHWFVLGIIAVFTVPILAISALIIAVNRLPPPEKPLDPVWRRGMTFRLIEAACLFSEIEPNDAAVKVGKPHTWMQLLDHAWEADDLEHISRQNPDTRVTTRQSLKRFAARYNVQPSFLNDALAWPDLHGNTDQIPKQ